MSKIPIDSYIQSDTCGFSSTNDSTDRRPYIVSNCCNEFLNVLALTALQQFRATILRFINEYSTQNINTLSIEIFRKSPSFGIFLPFIQLGCDDKFNLPNRNRLNRSVIFNLKSRYESPIQSRLKLIHIFWGLFCNPSSHRIVLVLDQVNFQFNAHPPFN